MRIFGIHNFGIVFWIIKKNLFDHAWSFRSSSFNAFKNICLIICEIRITFGHSLLPPLVCLPDEAYTGRYWELPYTQFYVVLLYPYPSFCIAEFLRSGRCFSWFPDRIPKMQRNVNLISQQVFAKFAFDTTENESSKFAKRLLDR